MNMQQNTPEWEIWRKEHIGASDIPIILGLSKYMSPYNLWRYKLGFLPAKQETDAMRRGKYLEPIILERVNKEGDFDFKSKIVVSDELSWAVASLDGYDEKENIVLEIKATSKANHELAIESKLPPDHFAQVQWQLFVSGAPKAIYSHFYDNDLINVELNIDIDYIKDTLLPAASHFYKCMIMCEPPEISTKDYVFIDDEDFGNYAKEWKYCNTQKKKYEDLEKELRNKLLDFTDDGNCEGFGIKITKMTPRKTVNWKKLYEEILVQFPEIEKKFPLEKYTSESAISWRIQAED